MSARKTWPARLVATVTALALVFACTFGVYAHAAGHHAHRAARQAMQGVDQHDSCHKKVGHVHDAPGNIGHAHVGDHAGLGPAGLGPAGHDGGDADTSAADCCVLCHIGQAILVAAAVIPHPPLEAPVGQPAAALHGAPPNGLDRPPKASVRA